MSVCNPIGLPCPDCGSTNSDVTDSRPAKRSVRRRRTCLDCGARWTTMEIIYVETADSMKRGRPKRLGRSRRPNLDAAAKAKIARLAAEGKTQTAVAESMRLAQSTVSRHWPR